MAASEAIPDEPVDDQSMLTVIVALAANGLLALAKSVAAVLTGSASMVAEAAHSWADTGNEVFLVIAERKGKRPRDEEHPRGYGRATYFWSLVAAFGLFSAGALYFGGFSHPDDISPNLNVYAFTLGPEAWLNAARAELAMRQNGINPRDMMKLYMESQR